MKQTDEDLEWFLEQFGPPTASEAASDEVIRKFRGKLPDQLLTYWQELGFCGFKNGLFWLVNPDDYEAELEAWLGDTEVVEQDAYYVIARSGFGRLFLWGTKTGYKYHVDPTQGWIYGEDRHTAEISLGKQDECLRRFLSGTNPKAIDMKGDDKQPLFDRAASKLGPLAADEVFAFEPALVAGGSAKLGNITKRNIHVHLTVLAQLSHREILDREALTRKAFG
ncbi:MAG TPA: GAD-like domain-containing protein [Rhizobacter sp.]|nr:GAD-like domain-containing protein [Rhizobacter sp.]